MAGKSKKDRIAALELELSTHLREAIVIQRTMNLMRSEEMLAMYQEENMEQLRYHKEQAAILREKIFELTKKPAKEAKNPVLKWLS